MANRWQRESPRRPLPKYTPRGPLIPTEQNADLMGGAHDLTASQETLIEDPTDQSVDVLKKIRRARDLVFVTKNNIVN